MLAPDQRHQVAANWQNAEHRIRVQAPHEIHMIRPKYRSLVRDLTRRGLVHRAGDDVRITTRTRTVTDTRLGAPKNAHELDKRVSK